MAANPIVVENQNPGTPESVWQVAPGQDSTLLQGFTTSISTDVGGQVNFKIDNLTGSGNYTINIYRLGYYGGDGARLVNTIQHQSATPVVQPNPDTDPTTGLVDAGNWQVTDTWNVPSTAVSGVYIANIVQGTQVFQIPFVIKNSSSTSDIVFQTSDETWQAYNGWGGADLYGGNGPAPPSVAGVGAGAAYAVSYNRPITTLDSSGVDSGPQDTVFGAEYSAIYWLEENGYDVSYIAGLDTATNGSLLLNHKIFMDAGHDEYWTDSQVANVQAAAKAGVNLAFLSGNEMFWQTRLAPSIDGTSTANRTLISYKDTHFQTVVDPNGVGTGTFESPPNMGGAGMPSNAVTGTVFQVDGVPALSAITIPFGETNLRIWRNTAVAATMPGQSATLASDLLGYEWDSSPDNGFRPVGLVDLSSTTVSESNVYNTDFGNVDTAGTATHNLVEYRDPTSGALVFGAGTVFWSWGLADQSVSKSYAPLPADPNVQQAMVNLFADMGVQPATLQASLVAATQSTDHTAPTSTINSVSTTAPVEGQSVTVMGSATDVGGVIADVDVSTDGGATWHPTTLPVGAASENWTYTFTAPAPGTYTIESRAVDDSINLETPRPGVSYTVSASPSLTLFNATDTPATLNAGDAPVELGLKFTSSKNGTITGIRFYKGPSDSGPHAVDLWSATGTLLASGTSTNETASGWQQVTFASPVPISAGTTYVASYHSNGDYTFTPYYFDTLQGTTKGALHAIGDGLNGVSSYSSGSIFPSTVSTFGDNYWVDVVFNDGSGQALQANSDSGFVATENTPLSIPASALLANDTDSSGLTLSVTGVNAPSNGTVSYDPNAKTVTFTPTTGYTGPASFNYTVTDGQNTGSAGVSLVVNPPSTAQTVFDVGNTPTVVTVNDGSSVDLGMKFQAATGGTITAIRFYKGPQNTGTHVGDLWTATGTLLASATFTNETASGWQQVNLTNPVAITAGTIYVVSYQSDGFYSADNGYFATAHTNGALTAPASGTSGGNGVYVYGSGTVFPTNTFQSANYWVDIVFNGGTGGTVVANNDSGFATAENTALSIPASALLANDTDSSGLTLSVTGVSNPTNGTVSYDPNAKAVTFTPTTGYTGPASFNYAVSDGQNTGSASVSLTVNAPGTSQTLFSTSDTPAVVTVNDPSAVDLGMKFQASTNGTITAIRFYKGPQNTGTHVGDLWSASGTLLATATFTNETASGWQQVNLASPVAVAAGTTYVVSYQTNGDYSATDNYFATAHTNGALTAPSSAASGGNGVYAYGSGAIFPTNTFQSDNYWVDVVFSGGSGGAGGTVVANNDSGFVATENTALSIPASALLANDTDSSGLTLSVTGVSNPTNGTVSYDPTGKTVTFTPTTGYTGPASFNYAVSDGTNTGSASVSLSVNPPSTAQTLFSASSTPAVITVNDPNAVELGIKIQASENGTITGIRFYKGPQNTGTHVADLWSTSGTLLATANFTNETASGWQEADFSSPVSITAGTTYIAAYHTNGDYSADPNLFANSVANGPLTAPSSASSGGNGVYAYGGSDLFPTNTFNATSYAVDVAFRPQLAG